MAWSGSADRHSASVSPHFDTQTNPGQRLV
jgi:hypothetical protein